VVDYLKVNHNQQYTFLNLTGKSVDAFGFQQVTDYPFAADVIPMRSLVLIVKEVTQMIS
jgi:hypothetical protein